MADETLSAADARIDVDDVPVVDGLTLATTTKRALVLGAPRALFEAACGLRSVVRGKVTVLGVPATEAVRDRVVAGVPFEPPLPPKWTPIEYATWSARLAGIASRDAATAAKEAAEKVKLGTFATTRMDRLPPHARRAVAVAAALATGARAFVLDDPLGGLAEELARTWGTILVEALGDAPWVVFAPRAPLTSPLAVAAEEAFVVSGSRVDAHGAPARLASEGRRYVARIHGSPETFTAKLTERGAKVDSDGARLLVDLGAELTTHELLGIARAEGVVVVELSPIARALA